jgi:hypothetical protein
VIRPHTLTLAALLATGCIFDSSGMVAGDAIPPDLPAPVLDLPTGAESGLDGFDLSSGNSHSDLPDLSKPDLTSDLPEPDLPEPDLPKPDLLQPDLPPPDFSLGDAMTDAAIALCKAKYGAAPGYVLCWVTPSGCAFNATTAGTCDAMCKSLGGSCLAAWDNSTSSPCSAGSPDPCDKTRNTNICLCSI